VVRTQPTLPAGGAGVAQQTGKPASINAHAHHCTHPWGCPLCPYWAGLPWFLEGHTDAEHPGWTASYELVRPLPRQVLRVVYRRVAGQGPAA
jgi:hypothetical protein